MIVAEIYVPVFDASYDFKLDENVPTGVVIEGNCKRYLSERTVRNRRR